MVLRSHYIVNLAQAKKEKGVERFLLLLERVSITLVIEAIVYL